jgi:hypothetical protein
MKSSLEKADPSIEIRAFDLPGSSSSEAFACLVRKLAQVDGSLRFDFHSQLVGPLEVVPSDLLDLALALTQILLQPPSEALVQFRSRRLQD